MATEATTRRCAIPASEATAPPDDCVIFTIVLKPMPARYGQPPAMTRLRRLLKAAGRYYGLRCVSATAGGGDQSGKSVPPPPPPRPAIAGTRVKV